MAQVVEARLTDDFNSSVELNGVIHSKFRTVINVLFVMPGGSRRLIAIITNGTKGIPDSITVPKEYFEKISLLPVGSKLLWNDFTAYFTGISEPLEGNALCLRQDRIVIENFAGEMPNLINYPEKLKTYCGRYTDGFLILGSKQKSEIESSLEGFSKAWLEHDTAKMEAILLKYVGTGIGLTPSCDDAFLGIIAVYSGAKLYADTPAGRTCKMLKPWRNLLNIESVTPFNKLLFNRTTDVSLKYLCCSQEGRFSDPVIDLVRAIFAGARENMESCIKSVSEVGGSSGMDTLFGTDIACRKLRKSIGIC